MIDSPFLPDDGEDLTSKTENELFELMRDTAEDIYHATISPDQWPNFIILLIWFLETHAGRSTLEKHLATLRARITDRLTYGHW